MHGTYYRLSSFLSHQGTDLHCSDNAFGVLQIEQTWILVVLVAAAAATAVVANSVLVVENTTVAKFALAFAPHFVAAFAQVALYALVSLSVFAPDCYLLHVVEVMCAFQL